jgi:hypothetical protein
VAVTEKGREILGSLGLPDTGRAFFAGAVGGLLGLLLYKFFDLLARGFTGGSFQLTPAERLSTIAVIVVIGILILLSSRESSRLHQLRSDNDAALKKLTDDLERLTNELR